MLDLRTKLIVALDVDTIEKAQGLVDLLLPKVDLFKVGSQLFTACGPEVIKMIGLKKAQVFLDLKFHDIPNTVYNAVASGTSSSVAMNPIPTGSEGAKIEDQVKEGVDFFPVFMMTLHTIAGKEALKEAVRGASEKAKALNREKPYLVGVTVLTSDGGKDVANLVLERAKLAQETGLDGVVCSAHEAAAVRKACGEEFIIVTPGIRPAGGSRGDQRRVATPQDAVKAGSNFIVVGRPILEADNPLRAVQDLSNCL